ncbi:MAG: hypothetical protein JWQ61_893 [Collimonas fungivorans]|jgi:hypothetical protein|uniref:hypothetical protein n=1 Tax=Collimonas fungivorans TaxID=158899 RepID=UPI0026ED79C1|nr:hypothetical protein [Collimonas fungivorans]MDB5766079.1 hypothetical protein [Collimonas fungivorans]
MEKSENSRHFVESQHIPERIEVSGFDAADDSVHMLEWMRKGRDVRQFVVNDIETELYSQDANSQLLSVTCKAKPNFETKVKTDQQAKNGVVIQFFAAFPMALRVRAANGAVWKLDVEHSYQATNLDVPDEFQLRLNFTIVGHQVEA